MECFCLDLTATQTKSILGINRNTINRFFMLFRKLILQHQSIEFGAMIGEVELDECYFGPNRIRGGVQAIREGAEHQDNLYLEYSSEMAECTPRSFHTLGKRFYEKSLRERWTLRVLYTQMGGEDMMD